MKQVNIPTINTYRTEKGRIIKDVPVRLCFRPDPKAMARYGPFMVTVDGKDSYRIGGDDGIIVWCYPGRHDIMIQGNGIELCHDQVDLKDDTIVHITVAGTFKKQIALDL